MDYGLSGKRALVTGASRGIGRAIALTLAREGAEIAVAARSAEGLEETCRRAGGAVALPTDLSRWDEAEALPGRAADALGGPIQLLVTSHGYMTPLGQVHRVRSEQARAAMDLDLSATIALLGAAAPDMMGQRHGRIVLIGSRLGEMGLPKATLNSTIKAALHGLVRSVALDLGRFGVTANLVAAGFIDTERLRRRHPEPEAFERMRRSTSVRDVGLPGDVAEVVAFLCSDAARYVTGAVVPVDGGVHVAHLFQELGRW